MAHRIAELIEKAEQAEDEREGEEARRECADLILRVWSHRSGWPHGQPLAKIASNLKSLAAERSPYGGRFQEPEERSWIGVLPLLEDIHRREQRVHYDAALAGIPSEELEKAESWLEEQGENMSEEEADTLRHTVELVQLTRSEHFSLGDLPAPRFGTLPEEERTRLAKEALDELDDERLRLREHVPPGESEGTDENDGPSTE